MVVGLRGRDVGSPISSAPVCLCFPSTSSLISSPHFIPSLYSIISHHRESGNNVSASVCNSVTTKIFSKMNLNQVITFWCQRDLRRLSKTSQLRKHNNGCRSVNFTNVLNFGIFITNSPIICTIMPLFH